MPIVGRARHRLLQLSRLVTKQRAVTKPASESTTRHADRACAPTGFTKNEATDIGRTDRRDTNRLVTELGEEKPPDYPAAMIARTTRQPPYLDHLGIEVGKLTLDFVRFRNGGDALCAQKAEQQI
ncbi:hypothetical protein SPHINGOT1_340018 [Sphingomonas sp. T1]|nr:hypothetical protein SPHINGOT1_340018 [Sphingomonas sp. T1]